MSRGYAKLLTSELGAREGRTAGHRTTGEVTAVVQFIWTSIWSSKRDRDVTRSGCQLKPWKEVKCEAGVGGEGGEGGSPADPRKSSVYLSWEIGERLIGISDLR